MKKAFAAHLVATRERSGWTQETAAARAQISTRYYQSLEAGDKLPSLETVFKLADAFDCGYAGLLDPLWKNWRRR